MSKLTEKIIWNIKNGEFDAVQTIFQNDAQKVNEEMEGSFPLHFAADYGQLQVLQFLIEMGADINKKDKHGITPLLAAVWEGHTSCVKLLLEKGASKIGSTPGGQTYIEAADKDEIKMLLADE